MQKQSDACKYKVIENYEELAESTINLYIVIVPIIYPLLLHQILLNFL